MDVISPRVDNVWSDGFITYRRLWLDTMLSAFEADMRGIVLDVGGKRKNKRGSFDPPEEASEAWWYVNLDLTTQPNLYADVTTLPVKSESINCVICTEVIEHLENPLACAQEIYRVLQQDGIAFFSIPFMYPIHSDPYDFRRLTADGLRQYLSLFHSIEIYPMGGYLGTLAMLMEIGIPGFSGSQIHKKITRHSLTWFAKYLYQTDIKLTGNQPTQWTKYTSGYFARVVK